MLCSKEFFEKSRAEMFDCGVNVANEVSKVTHMFVRIILNQFALVHFKI